MSKLSPRFLNVEDINSLASAKILSVIDFLQSDVERIVSHSKLTPEKVLELKSHLIKEFSVVCVNGFDLLKSTSDGYIIETHILSLDELLCGGVLKGSIIEFCGPSGSGKTQLCHSIAVNTAANSVLVEYIDTKMDFSASRCNLLLPNGLSDKEMDDVLERIKVYQTRDIYDLVSVLEKIKCNLTNTYPDDERIIVIDSLTVPFLHYVGSMINKGLGLVNFIASVLKQMATEHNLAVIVTNLGVPYEDNEPQLKDIHQIKPLMGKYWQHVPNTRIIVTRELNSTQGRKLKVHKSDYLPINKTGMIYISNTGIS